MKTKFPSVLLLCALISFTGCNKGEKAAMQSQINGLQNENDASSKSNLVLQGNILALQEKVKSNEEINTLLQQQLDSANRQLKKTRETAEANAVQEKNKPVEETIRAFRKFNSIVTVSVTFDEYRQGLQELKTVLDANNSEVDDRDIAKKFLNAYADYQDAFVVWGASLGQNLGDYEAALKKHGHWLSKIPENEAASYEANYDSTTNMPSALRVTPISMYNYDMLKYDVSPCLQACSSSAKNLIDDVEQKIRGQ